MSPCELTSQSNTVLNISALACDIVHGTRFLQCKCSARLFSHVALYMLRMLNNNSMSHAYKLSVHMRTRLHCEAERDLQRRLYDSYRPAPIGLPQNLVMN